ncbi:MAG: exopolysaccharide biosynthesis protein, partial [Candidatus Methylomirabilota bacterium]
RGCMDGKLESRNQQGEPVSAPSGSGAGEPLSHLSEALRAALEHAGGKAITLGALFAFMGERGQALLMLLLAFPFLLPVPTMGLSAPAGFAIACLGLCLAARAKPWLPGVLARREIPYETLEKVVTGASGAVARLERILGPRLHPMFWPGMHAPLGIAIFVAGVGLGLPIPLPFANAVPALALILFALGLLERDGLCILAGHAVVLLTLGLAYLLWEAVRLAVTLF